VYKFTLKPTEVTLHDPTVPGESKPNFIQKGLTYTKFPTKVKNIGSSLYDPGTNSGLDSNQKELYEKELEEILKNNIDNIEEVIVFDHVIRSSKVAGKGTKISGMTSSVFTNRPSKLRSFRTRPDHQNFPDRSKRTRTGPSGKGV
jgi:hypothetical protein